MVNHGLSTAGLFLLVAMFYERSRTRDLTRTGGMYRAAPALGVAFLLVALASLGLPGLNHFVGEFLVILGTFASNRGFGVIAAVGVVLSAIYLLWAYQRMMHGPLPVQGAGDGQPAARSPVRRDLRRLEYAVLVPLIAAIVAIGVYPKPFLDRINPSARDSVREVVESHASASPRTEAGGP